MKKIELKGKRFHRLLVLEDSGKKYHRNKIWLCQCDCGKKALILGGKMTSGNTKSCGCWKVEVLKKQNYKHGYARSRGKHPQRGIYMIWAAMIQRCNNPKNARYSDYGGRGITVSAEWIVFENFLRDMKEKPKDRSLDRIDNDKGYSKENCRWATLSEQRENQRQCLPKKK